MQPSKAVSIPSGSRGVLISCVIGKETKAGREATNVFQEAYEHFCPDAADLADGDEAPDAGGDISELLANEVKDLKDRSKQLFTVRNMSIPSLVYVSFNYKGGPTPAALVAHVCREAQRTKQNVTRLCSRFYPVDRVCSSTLASMEGIAKEIAAESFPEDAKVGVQFSVEYERRAAPPDLDRMAVINVFANAVKQPPHKVNLSHPEKTILVNVAKGTCGVAVVEDFRELAKYNLRALAASEGGEAAKDADGGGGK